MISKAKKKKLSAGLLPALLFFLLHYEHLHDRVQHGYINCSADLLSLSQLSQNSLAIFFDRIAAQSGLLTS